MNFSNVRKTRQLVRKQFSKYRNQSKVICLTENWNSPLHWAHYGSGYDGVALKFVTLTELALMIDDDVPLQMGYSVDRPRISEIDTLCWLEGLNKSKNEMHRASANRAFDALNFSKLKEWSYEREWRLQKRFFGPGAYQYTPALKLNRVILGARVGEETRDYIVRTCDAHCDVVQAQLSKKDFSLELK